MAWHSNLGVTKISVSLDSVPLEGSLQISLWSAGLPAVKSFGLPSAHPLLQDKRKGFCCRFEEGQGGQGDSFSRHRPLSGCSRLWSLALH